MPFTFSHPAIILPLLKKRHLFSASALIAGSMTPDFESFILVTDIKLFSHHWLAVPLLDVPLGLALLFIFHYVVRDPLIAHLPLPLRERFGRYMHFNWGAFFRRHWVLILVSLLIGILSHLLWDAFTHLNIHYPGSRRSQIKIHGKRLYKILQYLSSIAGFAVMVWVIYKMPRLKQPRHNDLKYLYWLVITLVAVLFITIIVTVIYADKEIWPALYLYVIMSSFMYAIVVVSAVYRLFVRHDNDLYYNDFTNA